LPFGCLVPARVLLEAGTMKNLVPLGLLLVALLACGGQSATNQQLVARAASDLGCQNERIASRELDERTRIAVGCGLEATYVEDCETCTNGLTKMNETCDCTWVLSGAVRKRAGPTPVAPVAGSPAAPAAP
jgi:hypothetical protein